MKKEYRLANANVGDRPQIEEDMSDEEGLFGDHSLTADGKRLRRMMRKRVGSEDLFGDSDDVSGSSISSQAWIWLRHMSIRYQCGVSTCRDLG
jgi:transcription initiation factor TFIIF subunit alpha